MPDQKTNQSIIYLAIQMLLIFVFLVFPDFGKISLPRIWNSLGVTGIIIGFLIGFTAALNLKKSLSPYVSPSPKGKLITHGWFAYIRHPLYLGMIIFFIGFTLIFSSLFKFILLILLIIFFVKKANAEEKLLSLKFPEYKIYQKKTGKFFIRIF